MITGATSDALIFEGDTFVWKDYAVDGRFHELVLSWSRVAEHCLIALLIQIINSLGALDIWFLNEQINRIR